MNIETINTPKILSIVEWPAKIEVVMLSNKNIAPIHAQKILAEFNNI